MCGLLAQVDDVFFQQTFDAIAHAINIAEMGVFECCFDGTDEAGIDNGGCATGLSNNKIAACY